MTPLQSKIRDIATGIMTCLHPDKRTEQVWRGTDGYEFRNRMAEKLAQRIEAAVTEFLIGEMPAHVGDEINLRWQIQEAMDRR